MSLPLSMAGETPHLNQEGFSFTGEPLVLNCIACVDYPTTCLRKKIYICGELEAIVIDLYRKEKPSAFHAMKHGKPIKASYKSTNISPHPYIVKA